MKFQRFSRPQIVFTTNLVAFGIFELFLIAKFIKVFPKDLSQGIAFWTHTDLLIDYSSGFVRRGLSGELIDLVSNYIQPQIAVTILAWILFLSVVFGYVRLLSRSIKNAAHFFICCASFFTGFIAVLPV